MPRADSEEFRDDVVRVALNLEPSGLPSSLVTGGQSAAPVWQPDATTHGVGDDVVSFES